MVNKLKNAKRIIIAIVTLLLLVVVGFYFLFYRPLIKYVDTHTWATIRVTGNVEAETGDEFYDDIEFVKGDTYQLHDTTVIIEDITTDGEVTIKFEPEVYNMDDRELIEVAVINKEKFLIFKEVCNNGDSVVWKCQVISNRYE